MSIGLQTILPPADFEGALQSQPISFTVTGTPLLSELLIQVRGETVFQNSTFLTGWTSSIQQVNATAGGFDFLLIPGDSKAWKTGEVIEVYVLWTDAGDPTNTDDRLWSFTVEGEALSLSMYPMVRQSIRDMDGGEDGLLYKLFTLPGGLDDLWRERVFDPASGLHQLYNPYEIPAAWLPWLKAMVGLSRDLDFDPTEAQLRKIITLFPYLMEEKSCEKALVYAIRHATGNRFWIRNFFDLRAELEDIYLTEMLKDQDPNILNVESKTPTGSNLTWCTGSSSYPCTHEFFVGDLPADLFPSGFFASADSYKWLRITEWAADQDFETWYEIDYLVPGTTKGVLKQTGDPGPNAAGSAKWQLWPEMVGDFQTEVRVDDRAGSPVDRDLLTFFTNLVRPLSERVEFVFVDFLDTFPELGVLDDWQMGGNQPFMAVVNQLTIPAPDGVADLVLSGSESWQYNSIATRVQAGGTDALLHIRFLVLDADNFYYLEIDWNGPSIRLYKVTATTPSPLVGAVTIADLLPGFEDVFRINVLETTTGYRLQVQYAGVTMIDVTDASPHAAGPIAYASGGGSEEVYLSFVEVSRIPGDILLVGPFSYV